MAVSKHLMSCACCWLREESCTHTLSFVMNVRYRLTSSPVSDRTTGDGRTNILQHAEWKDTMARVVCKRIGHFSRVDSLS